MLWLNWLQTLLPHCCDGWQRVLGGALVPVRYACLPCIAFFSKFSKSERLALWLQTLLTSCCGRWQRGQSHSPACASCLHSGGCHTCHRQQV